MSDSNDRFTDPDPSKDYEQLAEGWDGTPAEGEAVIEAIEQEGIETTAGQPPEKEGHVATSVNKPPKEFVLQEPDSEETVNSLVEGLMRGNEYTVCATIVKEPKLTTERYEQQLTELERSVLFDLCCSFVRAEELVDPRIIAQVTGGA